MGKKILVVEDETSISKLIEYNLRQAEFEVHCVYDGIAVFEAVERFKPDLIVLDLMLPGMDGLRVCRKLREEQNSVPILILSALSDLPTTVAGLDYGADDYMTKPFRPLELISRIHAILRRNAVLPLPEKSPDIVFGRLTIRTDAREVVLDGKTIDLTPKEYDLLVFLCQHPGKVVSRKYLLGHIWKYNYMLENDTRIVDAHISHLRDKIEDNPRQPKYIVTIRNIGYKFVAAALDHPSDAEAPRRDGEPRRDADSRRNADSTPEAANG